MVNTIDLLVQMLAEERDNARRAREDRAAANEALMRARDQNREDVIDLKNAEAKIEEWHDYAARLRAMLRLADIDDHPDPPQAFTRQIPF